MEGLLCRSSSSGNRLEDVLSVHRGHEGPGAGAGAASCRWTAWEGEREATTPVGVRLPGDGAQQYPRRKAWFFSITRARRRPRLAAHCTSWSDSQQRDPGVLFILQRRGTNVH